MQLLIKDSHKSQVPGHKSKDISELLDLLAGDGDIGLAPELVELARQAMVLDVLAGRPEIRAALGDEAHVFLLQAALGALRLQELTEINNAMRKRGIDVVPLKGMAYGLMFESGGPTRQMADIDLLVKGSDYYVACEIMEKLGYKESFDLPFARATQQHERGFVRNGRLVEIHRAFLRGRRIVVDYDALWERTLPLDKDGVACRRLSPEDTLVYHCFHMGMHEFAPGGLRPVWEIRRLIIEDGPDLKVAAVRAREWNVLRTNWCALRLFEYCFPKDSQLIYPSGVSQMFEPVLPVRMALEKFVVGPSIELLTNPGILPRPVQLFRKALLVDRMSRVVSYLWWYVKAKLEVWEKGNKQSE